MPGRLCLRSGGLPGHGLRPADESRLASVAVADLKPCSLTNSRPMLMTWSATARSPRSSVRRRRFWHRGRCHRSRSGQRDGVTCIEALKRHRNGEDDRRGCISVAPDRSHQRDCSGDKDHRAKLQLARRSVPSASISERCPARPILLRLGSFGSLTQGVSPEVYAIA